MAKPRSIQFDFGDKISNVLKAKADAKIKGTEEETPQDVVENPADKQLLKKEAKSAEKNGWYLGKYASKAYEGLKGRVEKILDRNNIKLDGEVVEQVNEEQFNLPVEPASFDKANMLSVNDLDSNWSDSNWNPSAAGYTQDQIAGIQSEIGTKVDGMWGRNSRRALDTYLNSGNSIDQKDVINPYVTSPQAGYDFNSNKPIQHN